MVWCSGLCCRRWCRVGDIEDVFDAEPVLRCREFVRRGSREWWYELFFCETDGMSVLSFGWNVFLLLSCCCNSAVARPRVSPGLILASQSNTPRFTPPGSPPSVSASVSPTRTSKPVSPRRHSMSFSTSRGLFDDRSSGYGSVAAGNYGSVTGSDGASQTG